MNEELDQFLTDFYSKYGQTLTPEKRALIKQTYGGDYDGLITDLYDKYAPDNKPDSAKLGQIKSLYQLAAQPAPAEGDNSFGAMVTELKDAYNTPITDEEKAEARPDFFMNAVKRGANLGNTAQILNPDSPTPDSAGIAEIARLQQENQSLPSSEVYNELSQAQTFSQAAEAFTKDPIGNLVQVTAESMSAMGTGGWDRIAERSLQGGAAGGVAGTFVFPVIGTAGGVTGGMSSGAIVGMSETSLHLEYAGSVLESLQKAGVNTSDPKALQAAFEDDALISEARTHALKKGVPIALFDLISGGLAGRLVSTPAKSIAKKIGQGALELGVQGALGASGEAAGQFASGEEMQAGAIFLEGIGELGTSPVEVGSGALALSQNKRSPVGQVDDEINAAKDMETGDVNVDHSIDEAYQKIADELDKLELDGNQEDVKFETENPSLNDENEIPDNTASFTEKEAGKVQASVLPSPQEQEVNLDDSEATPAVDGREQFLQDESERAEFESQYTSDELDQMSNEDEFLGTKEGLAFLKEEAAKEALEIKAKSIEGQVEAKVAENPAPDMRAKEEKIFPNKVPDTILPTEKKERVAPQVDPEQEKQDRTIKYTKQLENIKKDKPNKQQKRLEILNENSLDLPEVNAKVREALDRVKAVYSEKEFAKQMKTLSPTERLDLIAARSTGTDLSSIQELRQFSTPNADESIAFEEFNVVQDAYDRLQESRGLLSAEKAEIQGLFNKIKKEYDTKLAPKREEVKKVEQAKKKDKGNLDVVKDKYVTAVAKAIELNNPVSIEERVKEYQKWRKENGLPEMKDEDVRKKAGAEYYKSKAHNEIKGESYERRAKEEKALRDKVAAQKKEEVPPSPKAEVYERPEMENPVWVVKVGSKNRFIQRMIGMNNDSTWIEVKKDDKGGWVPANPESAHSQYGDASFKGYTKEEAIKRMLDDLDMPPNSETKLLEGTLPEEFNDIWSEPKKVSINEVFDRIEKVYGNKKYTQSIKQLFNLAENISKKFYKNGLEVYLAGPGNLGSAAGMYTHSNQREIIILGNWTNGTTDAHEMVHLLTKALVHSIADKKYNGKAVFLAQGMFYNHLETIYKGAVDTYRDNLLRLQRIFNNKGFFTSYDNNLMNAISSYLKFRNHPQFDILNAELIQELIDNSYDAVAVKKVYGMTNADEMLAEALSNPYFAHIMSLLENPNPRTANTGKSFFKDMVDALRELIDNVLKAVGRITKLDHSYLDSLSDYLAEVEQTFLAEDAPPMAVTDMSSFEDLYGKIAALEIKENSALYMAAGEKLNKMTPALKSLLSGLAVAWWKRESLQSFDGVRAEMDKINAKTKKNKLGDAEAHYIWQKIQLYRQRLADAKEVQKNAYDFIKTYTGPTTATPEPNEYKTSKVYKQIVDDFAAVDLDILPINRVREFEKGMIDLAMGQIPTNRAFNIVNKDVAVKRLQGVSDIKKTDIAKNPSVGVKIYRLANPATYTAILSKYKKALGQKLFNTFYGRLLEARTNATQESNDFLNDLTELVNKQNLTHTDFASVGQFGAAFSTFLPESHPEYWNEVTENLNLIVENAQNKLDAIENEVYDGKIELARKELETGKDLQKRINSTKSMAGILTPRQQKMYDAIRAFSKKYENDLKRNTYGVWGSENTWQYNYFPTSALGRAEDGAVKTDALIPNMEAANNLWEGVQKNKSYGKVIAQQTGYSKKKVQPKGYFYDYDAFSLAHKMAPSVLFDLYATRELKSLNMLLNGIGNNPISTKGKKLTDIIPINAKNGFNHQIKSIVGGTIVSDAELNKQLKWVFKLRNNVATAALATTGQFLVQASSAVPASIIMHPTGFPKAMKVLAGFEYGVGNFGKLQSFLKENGLSIQLRDALFERWQSIEDVQKSGLERNVSTWKAWNERVATAALRRGDKFAARLVWFSAYFGNGGTLENPSKEAVLAAERAVGILQNMSDVSFSAPIFRTNDSAHRILMYMFYAFKSFALNSALNTWYSGRYFFNSGEARQVLLANLAMTASYQMVKEFLVNPAYGIVSESIFGGDGEDDDEKNFSKGEAVLWSTLWDSMLGQGTPAFADNAMRIAMAAAMERRATNKGEEFDVYKDVPIYVPQDRREILEAMTGTVGSTVETGIELTTLLMQSSNSMLEGEEGPTNEELMIDGLRSMALFTKMFPLRGDFQKLVKEYDKRLKAEKRKTGSGGDIESGTEFEFPEYDIDGALDPTSLPDIEDQ